MKHLAFLAFLALLVATLTTTTAAKPLPAGLTAQAEYWSAAREAPPTPQLLFSEPFPDFGPVGDLDATLQGRLLTIYLPAVTTGPDGSPVYTPHSAPTPGIRAHVTYRRGTGVAAVVAVPSEVWLGVPGGILPYQVDPARQTLTLVLP